MMELSALPTTLLPLPLQPGRPTTTRSSRHGRRWRQKLCNAARAGDVPRLERLFNLILQSSTSITSSASSSSSVPLHGTATAAASPPSATMTPPNTASSAKLAALASTPEEDASGWTALHHASRYGHLEAVRCLVELFGVDVYAVDHRCGGTALHYACLHGHVPVVQYYMEQQHQQQLNELGTNSPCLLSFRDARGRTPLSYACEDDTAGVVPLLLSAAATSSSSSSFVDVADDKGRTPLWWASLYNKVDTVKHLLQHGANANVVAWNGRTALSNALEMKHGGTVRVLIQHGGAQVQLDHLVQAISTHQWDAVYCMLQACPDWWNRVQRLCHPNSHAILSPPSLGNAATTTAVPTIITAQHNRNNPGNTQEA